MQTASWTPFALAALFFWGFWGLFTKMATFHLPARSVYLLCILVYLPIAVFLIFSPGLTLPWHPVGWAAAVGAGFCTATGLLCYFQALAAGGQASVVVPLTSLYPVVTVILSLLFLKEGLTLRQGVGLILAMVAVWLLAD
jgi:transporter family protein